MKPSDGVKTGELVVCVAEHEGRSQLVQVLGDHKVQVVNVDGYTTTLNIVIQNFVEQLAQESIVQESNHAPYIKTRGKKKRKDWQK